MKKIIPFTFFLCLIYLNPIKVLGQWVPQISGTSGYLTSVCFPANDTGYVSLESGNILKTVNGGQNWNMLGAGPWNSLVFITAQKGFGAGEGCILKTINGGASWDTCFKNPAVYGISGISFPDSKNGYAAALDYNMSSYVLKTSNWGNTWDTVYHEPVTNMENYNCIFFKDSLHGFAGGWMGKIHKTENGGLSWSSIPVDTINSTCFNSIYFPVSDTGYAAGDAVIFRTVDGGTTWQKLTYPFSSVLYSLYFTDARHGYVAGGDGFSSMILFQTTDAGNTWTQGATGTQTLSCVFFSDASTGFAVGGNGTILKYSPGATFAENFMQNLVVSLSPNPFVDKVSIDLPGISEHNIIKIQIINSQGKIIRQTTCYQSHLDMDLHDLSSGIYFLKIERPNGRIIREIVKE